MKSFNVICVLFVMGCAQTPQPLGKPLPDITYSHLNPYSAYSGGVEVRYSYNSDAQTQKVEQGFPLNLENLLKQYARNRFATTIRPIKMVFDVQKVRLSKKSKSENIIGFFTGVSEDVYEMDIFLSLSPVIGNGYLGEGYTISIMRKLSLAQNLSVAEREFRQFEFLEKAMNDIDRAVTQIITKRMH